MKETPSLLKYTKTHEWIKLEEKNIVRIGVTDHAQSQLGDIVFVELPTLEKKIIKNEGICVLESVKAAADVYSPLSGEIIEINSALTQSPDLVNSDPYGAGWLFCLKFTDTYELVEFLNAKDYEEQLTTEIH